VLKYRSSSDSGEYQRRGGFCQGVPIAFHGAIEREEFQIATERLGQQAARFAVALAAGDARLELRFGERAGGSPGGMYGTTPEMPLPEASMTMRLARRSSLSMLSR
jgi:hypothetical protein